MDEARKHPAAQVGSMRVRDAWFTSALGDCRGLAGGRDSFACALRQLLRESVQAALDIR